MPPQPRKEVMRSNNAAQETPWGAEPGRALHPPQAGSVDCIFSAPAHFQPWGEGVGERWPAPAATPLPLCQADPTAGRNSEHSRTTSGLKTPQSKSQMDKTIKLHSITSVFNRPPPANMNEEGIPYKKDTMGTFKHEGLVLFLVLFMVFLKFVH